MSQSGHTQPQLGPSIYRVCPRSSASVTGIVTFTPVPSQTDHSLTHPLMLAFHSATKRVSSNILMMVARHIVFCLYPMLPEEHRKAGMFIYGLSLALRAI